MAQRKVTCNEAWKQDLIDHRALREQLHTIRTASLEQRHGSESEWKMRKMWHILRSWKPSQTQIYKNMMLLHWVWFERSFSNQTVQSISSEMAWADFSPKYLYLLSSDSAVYFKKLHSNTSSRCPHLLPNSEAKNIQSTWNNMDIA